MKKLIIVALLCLPSAAYSQELSTADLEGAPAAKGAKAGSPDSLEPVQRPDAEKIMSELSTALRLSSKQEDRIAAVINKKTKEFDKLMKDFDKSDAEEKKWRYKVNATRHEMLKLKRQLPDDIREFLDDAQRESYDELLATAKKTAAAGGGAAVQGKQAGGAAKSGKKKRLVKRRKAPAEEAEAAPGEDEAGQTMVDKEAPPAPKKKRTLKKKPAAAEEEEPAGAAPTGKEAAPDEEDAGAYP
ncbi:MAG: hypothetical protein Q7R35_17345 [Elusimicrobiota bacterium]|nr:hypothetical protein [Elusimicrobiota bacterium]